MAGFSAYLRDALKAYADGTGTAVFTSSPTFYAALWNGDPTDAGIGGTEVTGTLNLTRQTVTFVDGGGDQVENDAEINFGTANGAGIVDHVAVFDAAAAGNLLFSVSIPSQALVDGSAVKIAAGALTVNFL